MRTRKTWNKYDAYSLIYLILAGIAIIFNWGVENVATTVAIWGFLGISTIWDIMSRIERRFNKLEDTVEKGLMVKF